VTTARLEEDVRACFEPLFAFDQFTTYDQKFFTSIVVLIDMRPFPAGQDVDNPYADICSAGQVSAVATITHFNSGYIVDSYSGQYLTVAAVGCACAHC
jgi:hypothetical protein